MSEQETTQARCEQFIAQYSAEIAAEIRAARAFLHTLFPAGRELVYNNYNALVFALSPTERGSDAFLSIAAYPRWINLFFAQGNELDDPHGLLQGSGKRMRSIRLGAAADLWKPAVQALIDQAIQLHHRSLTGADRLRTTIKASVEKPRARRPGTRLKTPG